ncbi:PleD family two-component system response regulator [Acidaminobacter sp. JC074]|uniref:response regulator n=1 Tax=Acidaminobacter sp. JC074 TaxID=2530199 RepID=UPI001F0F71E3|nr:response regulator [Acidaminobacter sp. JC074]
MQDKKIILIVDDVKMNIDLLDNLLSKDFKLHAALNGRDAIKIAKLIQPQLILLDVNMPDLDGYTVAAELKKAKQTKAIPIIMVTANNSSEDELACLISGATDFISKPINRDLLLLKIIKYI